MPKRAPGCAEASCISPGRHRPKLQGAWPAQVRRNQTRHLGGLQPMLKPGDMKSILRLFGIRAEADEHPGPCLKALATLHVSSLPEARRRADRVLAKARHCPCCSTLLDHVFDQLPEIVR